MAKLSLGPPAQFRHGSCRVRLRAGPVSHGSFRIRSRGFMPRGAIRRPRSCVAWCLAGCRGAAAVGDAAPSCCGPPLCGSLKEDSCITCEVRVSPPLPVHLPRRAAGGKASLRRSRKGPALIGTRPPLRCLSPVRGGCEVPMVHAPSRAYPPVIPQPSYLPCFVLTLASSPNPLGMRPEGEHGRRHE